MFQDIAVQFLIAIMGPTASGKTGLAEAVAERLDAVLINADAFQVYRHLDIGTAKPERKHRYRLLDIKNPNEEFGVGHWAELAQLELRKLFAEGRHCIVVGGTGFYVRALFEEYRAMRSTPDPILRQTLSETPLEIVRKRLTDEFPELAAATDLKNPVRVRRALERGLDLGVPMKLELPQFKKLKFGLDLTPEMVLERIERRAQQMMQNGWTREIEDLRRRGYQRSDPGLRAIGYRPLWDALDGKIGLDDAIATTIAETRRYAKRQRTWLRSEPSLTAVPADPGHDAFRACMERIEDALK